MRAGASERRGFNHVTPFERHLQAAHGYLELGLPLEANEEAECIPSGLILL